MGVMTGPLAIIKVAGNPIGKAKNIRVNESFQRGRVVGVGNLTPSELPVTGWNGTMNMGFYNFNFSEHALGVNAILRKTNNVLNFVNTILLEEDGLTVDILKKVKDVKNPDGTITPKFEIFASVRNAFVTSDNFDVSEGQISGRDTSFEYKTPVFYMI